LGCTSPNIQNVQSNNPDSQYIKHYNKAELDSIIQHNTYTVIFGWTEWCEAGHNQLKDYLIPFLKEEHTNIGVISICCADFEVLADFLEKNDYKFPVYLLPGSLGGLDKRKLNKLFHKLFDNYKSVNYVPIVLLCDPQKQILNWDAINGKYQGVAASILQAKDNFY
jgi:glutaredoxin-related protein